MGYVPPPAPAKGSRRGPTPAEIAGSVSNCRCVYCGTRIGGLSNAVRTCPGCGAPRPLFSYGSPAPPLPGESGEKYAARTGLNPLLTESVGSTWQ